MRSRLRRIDHTMAGRAIALHLLGAVTVQANQKLFECFILSLRLAFFMREFECH